MMSKKRQRDLYRWLLTKFSVSYSKEALRCYRAEEDEGTVNDGGLTKKELRALVVAIKADPYWHVLRKEVRRPFRLRLTNRRGRVAWGGVDGIGIPDSFTGRTIHTVIHEMAHAALGGGGHGKDFLTVMLYLMTRFEGMQYVERLKARLRARGAL